MRHPTETQAIRISDFVTLRQLHALEVYDSVLRPFDLNHCVTARFFRASRAYDLSCARDSVDFSRRDVLLLEVVATVLGMAVRLPPPLVPQQLESMGITEREAQVLDHVARGRSNAEIAGELSVAPGTVKKHLDNIFEKLGVRNRVAAARIWILRRQSERGGSRALALACRRPGRLVQPARLELPLFDPQLAREQLVDSRGTTSIRG